MNIAYVTDSIYPYNTGGKEKRLYEISCRLARMGHEVHIYTMQWWPEASAQRIENGVYLHAICRRYELYYGNRRSIREALIFAFVCLKLVCYQFDVLDVDHMPFFPVFSCWLVCRLKRRCLFATVHEALSARDWRQYMGPAGLIACIVERFSTKLPHAISAASTQTKLLLARYHHRYRRVMVIGSGIDSACLQQIQPVRADCDVLYTGRLVKDKHVETLVRAIGRVVRLKPKVCCVIIGRGPEKARLIQLVQELDVAQQVTFLEPLPDAAEVYAYMKRAKVFVLPSVREGFGIAALEALACGAPVITADSNMNAARLLIDAGCGSIAPLDPRCFAAEIIKWLEYPARSNMLPKPGNYDWDQLAARQIEVYKS